ncbi:Nn.00g051410.m01.CDS01 [Neocucurbitaria sp. VM-36]
MSFMPSFDWLRGQSQPVGPFIPTYADVCCARALLKALQLPTELVLDILDYAHYWPTHEFKTIPNRHIVAAARGGRPSAATLCLDAGIFNNTTINDVRAGGERPRIKSVEFDIVSRDQGFTSEGTEGTFTTSSWLEVSILRNETNSIYRLPGPRLVNTWISSPLDFHTNMVGRGWYLASRPTSAQQGPQDGEGDLAWYLQGNRVVAGREEYRVIWTEDESEGNEGAGKGEHFVQELKDGDRILVWARAKWPGWQCIVESLKITVRYGF